MGASRAPPLTCTKAITAGRHVRLVEGTTRNTTGRLSPLGWVLVRCCLHGAPLEEQDERCTLVHPLGLASGRPWEKLMQGHH